MPTENQRAMRRVFNKGQDADEEEHAKQFGMTADELCVEIDGHKARPKPVVKKDKASLYQGNESIYDAYHEALSKKFHRDLLAEFQNSNLAVCELFDTGKGNESTRTRERSVDRRSLRLSVMGGASRKDTRTSTDGEPLTPSKAGGSTTGTSVRDRANSKSSGDSDGFSANEEDQKLPHDSKKGADGPRKVEGKTGDKALKSKRDPRRLVPIKVEDRSQVQGSANKTKGSGQSKEPTSSRAKARAANVIEDAERERDLKRRQMNARRDEKIRQLRGEKEFGIETDEKLKEEIQKDVQKELNRSKKGKPVVKEGVRIRTNEDGLDPDGGLEIPDVVFREIDSEEEERIAQRKFARMHGDEEDEPSDGDEPPQRRQRPPVHSDDSSDSAPKPLGRGNLRNKPNRRSASKDSQDSESVEYSRSSLKQSSKHNQNYNAGPELSYDEDAIDGDLDDEEEEDPDLAGVTDKRLREDIIAYKQKLSDAAEEEKKLDGSVKFTQNTGQSSEESVLSRASSSTLQLRSNPENSKRQTSPG